MAAGKLREVLSFRTRQNLDDGAGNEVSGPWIEQCKAEAEVYALRGGEAVLASRLEGKQPFIVTVRHNVKTAQVTTDWSAADTRSGQEYAIQTVVPRPGRDYIDMMVVSGVALG
jgi:head-tail adaptor